LPVTFEQFLPPHFLRVIAIEDFNPSALLSVFHVRTNLCLATMPSRSSLQTRLNSEVPLPSNVIHVPDRTVHRHPRQQPPKFLLAL
jgi:hypothetical protein